MTLTTPYSATFYVGDGERKTFPYLFDEVSENFITVIVYNTLTGQSSTPTYIVDTDQKQVIFGDDTPAPTADETVCIYRNTPNVQDVPFRTLHGYDAKTLENILSKIVAMIQEIKSNYFTTQVLQGDPWQLDLLSDDDDGATINIDYTAKKLVKGLYFRITDGNLQVSADGSNYITMPKSTDVAEFRQEQTELPDHTYQYRLQYRVGNTWYNAESNAEATADEALEIAKEARETANDAKNIVDSFDGRLTQAESDASDAKSDASDAKNAVNSHLTDYNNPHQVSKAQVGLSNVDNTSDLDKPISTATQAVLTAQQEEIDALSGRGRFLALWNCATGLAESNPPESPYPYKAGDYFVVGTVSSATPAVNYKPDGSSYTTGVASTTVETNEVSVNDTYFYDGSVWKLQSNAQKEVSFSALAGSPYDNTNLSNALNAKQDNISDLATIRSGASAGATAVQPADLATVATTGDYDDLLNKPTIPAAQVNSDWNANSGVAQILNKPTLAAVATSGAYSDLSGTPTIPTKLSELTGDVDISSATAGQHLVYDGSKWKNTASSASISWGGITGTLSNQTDLQNALDGKQATITGAATTITTNNLSAARALVSDSTGKVAVSTVTSTELGYMHGVTSNVQTQLNNKQATLMAGNGIDITGATISVDDLDCGTM